MSPSSVKINFNLGLLQKRQSKYREAIQSFENTIEIAPRFSQSYIELCDILEKNGDSSHCCLWLLYAIETKHSLEITSKFKCNFFLFNNEHLGLFACCNTNNYEGNINAFPIGGERGKSQLKSHSESHSLTI